MLENIIYITLGLGFYLQQAHTKHKPVLPGSNEEFAAASSFHLLVELQTKEQGAYCHPLCWSGYNHCIKSTKFCLVIMAIKSPISIIKWFKSLLIKRLLVRHNALS